MISTHDGADRPAPGSHLFTLRLWLEDLGGGQTDWRGRVQHVTSGEVRYVRDWQALAAFVEALLYGREPEPAVENSEASLSSNA